MVEGLKHSILHNVNYDVFTYKRKEAKFRKSASNFYDISLFIEC